MSGVSIVLISHSPKIAEGLKDLIEDMIHDVPIDLAGGTDENEIGTSIDKILHAISNANRGKGVLLFYDIGSAKMNAEVAIEMTETENVKLVEAPFVEGAFTAAVESGMGKSWPEVYEAVLKSF